MLEADLAVANSGQQAPERVLPVVPVERQPDLTTAGRADELGRAVIARLEVGPLTKILVEPIYLENTLGTEQRPQPIVNEKGPG